MDTSKDSLFKYVSENHPTYVMRKKEHLGVKKVQKNFHQISTTSQINI